MDITENGRTRLSFTNGKVDWRRVVGLGIVSFFAVIWAWMGAGVLPYGTAVVRVGAVLISLTLLILHAVRNRKATDGPVNRRLLTASIVGEIVALWIMGAILGAIGRLDLLLPGLAIIVGLHFYPMARAVRVPAYVTTATAMTIVGFVSLAVPEPPRSGFVGLACAAILWITLARSLRTGKR